MYMFFQKYTVLVFPNQKKKSHEPRYLFVLLPRIYGQMVRDMYQMKKMLELRPIHFEVFLKN